MAVVVRKWLVRIVLMLVSALVLTGSVFASQKVALVIGNSNYERASSLVNPKNDADDIAQMLQDIGFVVTKHKNLGFNDMRLVLREFSALAAESEIALVYYAGHGMEVDKHNYLVPIDAVLASDRDVDFEAVSLELVTQAAGGASKLSLVLLDACRNNPFAASMKRSLGTRSIGRGLAKVEPRAGSLVGFAAKEGTVANDGKGRNSPYATALLKHLREPGLDVQFLFRKVRDAVIQKTRGGQEPFTYDSLPGERIYLVDPSAKITQTKVTKPQASSVEEHVFWTSVRDSGDLRSIQLYIERYPNGVFEGIAKLKLLSLEDARGDKLALEEETRVAILKKKDTSLRPTTPTKVGKNKCDQLAGHSGDPENTSGYSASFSKLKKQTGAAIAACEKAIARFPDVRRMYFQLGRAHKAQKDYDDTLRYYEQASDMGHALAQADLATMYEFGKGVTKSYSTAAKYYEKAVQGGNALAMANLAYLYEQGNGVEKDYGQAIRYYKLGVKAGNARAMNNLGFLTEKGRGTDKDLVEAARLYKMGADAGNANAMANLGYFYEKGRGVKKSYTQAAGYYRKGADAGNARAMTNLGYFYEKGRGVKKSLKEAARFYRKGAIAGNSRAMTNLGYFYERGFGVERSYIEAAKFYKKGANSGNARAMTNLGYFYEIGRGVDKSLTEAVSLYERGANAGNSRAMTNLGFLYEMGRGVDKDYKQAVHYYRMGAKAGNAQSLNNMGGMYRGGRGVKKDLIEAAKFYKKAAAKGNSNAMTSLGFFYEKGQGVRRDDKEAVRYYKMGAKAGNGQSMHNLGNMYYNGRGVRKDTRLAASHIFDAIRKKTQFSIDRMTKHHDQLSKEFRIELQRKMKQEGFYNGPLDGDFGPATQQAILNAGGKG